MTDRAWTPAERAWIEAVIRQRGNLAHLDGEAIEKKLDEAGLGEALHGGARLGRARQGRITRR